MERTRPSRIDILQVLRLFASAMIILYHSDRIGSRGYFGVSVFFVLSGFLALHTTNSPVAPGRYLLRRAIRLLPLYWIFTVITFVILTARPGISNMSDEDPLHFLYSMLFIPYIGKTGTALPILAVGWTMYYEVAFTVLFALALLISRRHRFAVCSALLLLLTAAGLILKPQPVFLQFYMNPWLFDFFLGLLACAGYHRLRRSAPADAPLLSGLSRPAGTAVRAALSAAALASLVFLLCNVRFSFPLHDAFRLGIPSCILLFSLVLLLDRAAVPSKLLTLGNMTYSVFLVEYFTTSVYKRLLPGPLSLPLTVLSLLALFAVTFAVSVIPYSLIEVRLTAYLQKKLLPPRTAGKEGEAL